MRQSETKCSNSDPVHHGSLPHRTAGSTGRHLPTSIPAGTSNASTSGAAGFIGAAGTGPSSLPGSGPSGAHGSADATGAGPSSPTGPAGAAGIGPSSPPGSGGADGGFLPPPASEGWIVFREAFLFFFDPPKREVLRRAGEVLFTQVLSGDVHRPEEPWTHARLRSVVLDLRFVVQYLGEISREPLDSHPEDRDENRLAREVAGWAEELEGVARKVERAVDAWGGWGEGEG